MFLTTPIEVYPARNVNKTCHHKIELKFFNENYTYRNSLFWLLATLLFISVCILCEFAMQPDVYILLSPEEEEVHSWCTLLPLGTDVHIWQNIHQKETLRLPLY